MQKPTFSRGERKQENTDGGTSEQNTNMVSVNIHSTSNYSLLVPNNVFANSRFYVDTSCYFVKPSSLIFMPFTIVNIALILPLCVFILNHAFKWWRQNHSNSFATAMKHADVFTYHVAFLELVSVFGCFLCFCSFCGNYPQLLVAGVACFSFTCFGETFFHILTCLERYLAVVHPITYLSLRDERGIRIRNVIMICTWLLCVLGFGLMSTIDSIIISFFVLMLVIPTCFYCNLSVLRALIRPGPGKRSREKVDQSKMRAFYIILAILGVLVLRLSWGMVWMLQVLTRGESDCFTLTINVWFNLPSSLVLPLLFLVRTGKCFCKKNSTESRK